MVALYGQKGYEDSDAPAWVALWHWPTERNTIVSACQKERCTSLGITPSALPAARRIARIAGRRGAAFCS